MQKNLWICLILQKNRWLKYRFFALFRRTLLVRRAWRETRALAAALVPAPGEKPVRSEHTRCIRSTVRSNPAAGECRSPKVISVSVDLLHKIFIIRKDELVKDLPAT